MLRTLMSLSILLLLCGCGKVYQMKDSGKEITVTSGDTIEIELPGNPSTGYNWEVMEVDRDIVRPVSLPEYIPAEGKVGAGGTYLFKFLPVGYGETRILLAYKRNWETSRPPEKTYELHVIVEERP